MTPNSVKSANLDRAGRFVSQYDTSLICYQLSAAGSVAARWRDILNRAKVWGFTSYSQAELAKRREFRRIRLARKAAAQ